MCYFGLVAEFYENSSDEKPLYTVLMGCRKLRDNELVEDMGFCEDSQPHNYYTLIKENVTQQDLEELTKPKFHSELIDVLFDQDYERIRIVAEAYCRSKRHNPKWGAGINYTFIEFTHTEPLSPVIFMDCKSVTKNGRYTRTFKVPMIKLKDYFNVKTLYEVYFKLKEMDKERRWSYDELKNLFYYDESLRNLSFTFAQKDVMIEPVLLEDLIAVAVDGKSILFVREQDKNNEQAVGVMVETDNSMCCQFGLVQRFLKFRMMDIVQNNADLHDYYRTRIAQTFQPTAIYNLETEFRRQLDIWEALKNKWDYEFTKVFDCGKPAKRKIVYVDMDDVLVDFDSAVKLQPQEVLAQYKGRYDEIPGIFGLMQPMKGAIEAIDKLKEHFDMYILSTAPWNNPSAWKDKVLWVEKYFGEVFYKRLILSHHKDLCKGDYLIDDRTKNGAGEFEGELIRFGSNEFPDWERVVEYLMEA